MNPQSDNPGNNPLNVMSPGEQFVCEIKRHPFGLFGVYISSGILIVLILAGAIAVPHFTSNLSESAKAGVAVAGVVLSLIVLIYAYVATVIYKGNRWVVTSDSITQISQLGLFNKQTSQLSLANLEDVSFEQNSMIQSMFGFGLLKVETAGEHSKFSFPFCPQPSEYAKKIIAAHEQYIAERPENVVTANQALTATQGYSPQAYGSQNGNQQPPAGPQAQ